MSTACTDKDTAWAFLRTFLMDDYQAGAWAFPINRVIFESELEEAMRPIWQLDSMGAYELDENGKKIEKSQGKFNLGDNVSHSKYAVTPGQAERLIELIDTCTKVRQETTHVSEIAIQDAQAFFLGQKTAQEVATLIQSKVSLMVNEQM